MRLHLVRHGETDWNVERRNLGRSDIPLNARGLRQAELVSHALAGNGARAVVSSHLVRARHTAEVICRLTGYPHSVDERLAELDQGLLEGLTPPELHGQYPDLVAAFIEDPTDVRIPDGETLGEVADRAWAAIDDLTRPGDDVIVVSHNLTILSVVARALSLPLRAGLQMRVAPGSVTTLQQRRDRWELEHLNIVCHLDPMSRPR